ncbi:MAG: methyltransferase [Prevotella sp.]|jgi:tRNA1Val (adenine37-N6)-methyltransferase|nr:methyltransferase [Prevotella sp.]
MSNPYFRFKQFVVFHERCAMKVGTDGVLAGAWTRLQDNEAVLDVGAGSGLVSLMLAQRNSTAFITPIEIDELAAAQATENIHASPFRNIAECRNISFQAFAAQCTARYDVIVSNPPFFSASLKSPDRQRSVARHGDSLPIEVFIGLSAGLLSPQGRISFIFPFSEKEEIVSLSARNGLHVSRLTDVISTVGVPPKRVLAELSAAACETVSDELVIETGRGVYSPAFAALVQDFYLYVD